MKSMESGGTLSLPCMMKASVRYALGDSQKVLTGFVLGVY